MNEHVWCWRKWLMDTFTPSELLARGQRTAAIYKMLFR
jgi:hypothetical protein